MDSEEFRAYILISVLPGKENELTDYVTSKGLLKDANPERMDSVHGTFDAVMILRGTWRSIDARIMELRKSPSVLKTQTLLCSPEMLGT